jgi:hypothetical protein
MSAEIDVTAVDGDDGLWPVGLWRRYFGVRDAVADIAKSPNPVDYRLPGSYLAALSGARQVR